MLLDPFSFPHDIVTMELKAFCAPDLKECHLVSLQGICTNDGLHGSFEAHWNDDDSCGHDALRLCKPRPKWQSSSPMHQITMKCDIRTNLPEIMAHFSDPRKTIQQAMVGAVKVTQNANKNLTPTKKELLHPHHVLGHIDIQRAQWLVRSGELNCHHRHDVANVCELPTHAACLFGKMK